jgi:hypothetical protein
MAYLELVDTPLVFKTKLSDAAAVAEQPAASVTEEEPEDADELEGDEAEGDELEELESEEPDDEEPEAAAVAEEPVAEAGEEPKS